MTAAASKYTGTCPIASRTVAGKRPGATTATTLSPKATATPSPMSVNMLRRRVTSERHARSKNGQPAHKHTGVASASSIQGRIDGGTQRRVAASHADHRQEHERGGEQRRHPEAPRHVRELGESAGPAESNARLERHSADRTNARSDLHHLGIHRAGVLRPRGCWVLSAGCWVRVPGAGCWVLACWVLGAGAGAGVAASSSERDGDRRSDVVHAALFRRQLQVLFGIGRELRPAAGRTEVIRRTCVRVRSAARVRRIDLHAADRIGRGCKGLRMRHVDRL